MELIEVADQIRDKITLLEKGRQLIKQRAIEKSVAIAEYRKKLAIVMVKLEAGMSFEVDGQKIDGKKIIASNHSQVARGICWKEKQEEVKAEGLYKSAVAGMSALEAELNGEQSLFRHIEKQ